MTMHFRTGLASGLMAVVAFSQAAGAAELVGRISSMIGDVRIKNGDSIRVAALSSPIYQGETVVTGDGEAANVLLESRAVVKMDSNTEIAVDVSGGREQPTASTAQPTTKPGEMVVRLGQGTVVVYLAKRRPGDRVLALRDTIATIDATGTVFSATYSPQTRDGVYACEESSIKVRLAGGGVTTVAANQLARARDGQLVGPLQKLDMQEFRARTPALQRLSQQAAKRDAVVAQRRADAVTVRQVLAKDAPRPTGKTRQKSAQLADLLLGRCADLDALADLAGDGSILPKGIDGVVTTSNGKVVVGIADFLNAGGTVSLRARSCTDTNIKSIDVATLPGKKLDLYTVNVGSPNILELTFKNLNPNGKQNALVVAVAAGDRPKVTKFTTPRAPFARPGAPAVATYRILIRGK